jgi:hypothetical protein
VTEFGFLMKGRENSSDSKTLTALYSISKNLPISFLEAFELAGREKETPDGYNLRPEE